MKITVINFEIIALIKTWKFGNVEETQIDYIISKTNNFLYFWLEG